MFMGAPETGPSTWPTTLSLLWPTLVTVVGTCQPALPVSARGAGGESELRRCADLGKRGILSVKSEEERI